MQRARLAEEEDEKEKNESENSISSISQAYKICISQNIPQSRPAV